MNKPTVLLAHNYYKLQGGEDVVFSAEKELLQSHGHAIIEYVDFNDRIDKMPVMDAARQTIWSAETYKKIKKLVKTTKPDIAHLHNTFILISPSVYDALMEMDIPIVQTLHNYRLLCPNATFFRDGRTCEDCLGWKIPLPGIIHKCYRNSRAETSVVAAMLAYHRLMNTWQDKVDAYVALTEFSREKFIQGGLPADKITVKPNFLTPSSNLYDRTLGNYVLYIGRLSPEKGILVMLNAWRSLESIPLNIAGDGTLRQQVLESAANKYLIQYLGYQDRESIQDLLRGARFVVCPSTCYENFPMTIVESFANGIPVVASRLGAMAELVHDGETGLLFDPGNAADLAAKVKWLWEYPEESARMGRNARREYEQKYTPERNYQMLMDIYSRVIENRKK